MGDERAAADCSTGDPKLEAVAHLLRRRFGSHLRVLAVGCGDGSEAVILANLLDWTMTGVDVLDRFHPAARSQADLFVADARNLPFPDSSFDVVFSYHALEHIPDADMALAEIRRVTRPGGGVWIGTPNRSRLFGYLGSRDASVRDMVVWNITDWHARLRGLFRNELGAHAGFSSPELRSMLEAQFGDVQNETSAYYALLYPRLRRLFAILRRLHVARFVYASVYFAAKR